MTRGVKRAAAKALTPASIAPAPRPETKPKATIGVHHGVAPQAAALAATQEAAPDQQPAEAQPLQHRPGAEARDEVAGHRGEEDQAELIDRAIELAADRRPGDAQDAVGEAEAHEGEEGEGDEPAVRPIRHGGLSPL